MSLPHYIVVEGPIGVGKTTLVRALARRLDARTVFEVFAENPFLSDFYRDRTRYAFPTEMFFLLNRFKQQEVFSQEDLVQRHAVSDYLFDKCRLFAEVTLDAKEYELFCETYDILRRHVPTPDLVVYLHAPPHVLLSRIAARGRPYEQPIEADYLKALDGQYRRLFDSFDAVPVMSIDTTGIDFRDDGPVSRLLNILSNGCKPGPLSPTKLLGEWGDGLELF